LLFTIQPFHNSNKVIISEITHQTKFKKKEDEREMRQHKAMLMETACFTEKVRRKIRILP